MSTRTSHQGIYIPDNLRNSQYVFVRNNVIASKLTRRYTGLFKVNERKESHYIIERNGNNVSINLERLKPAFVENNNISDNDSIKDTFIPEINVNKAVRKKYCRMSKQVKRVTFA